MGLAAMYYRINGGKIPSGNNQSANGAGESTTSSENTDLLSGKEGDSVNVSTNPDILKLQDEQISLEMEKRYLELTLPSLRMQLDALDFHTYGNGSDKDKNDKVDEKSNADAEKLKKTIEAKEARLEYINKRLEEIKKEIAEIKAKDSANGDNGVEDVNNLTDAQKKDLISQKEEELRQKEIMKEKLEDQINNAKSTMDWANKQVPKDFGAINCAVQDMQRYGSELNKVKEEISALKAEIASLKGEGADDTDSSKPSGDVDVTTDEANKSELAENLEVKKQLLELKEQELENVQKQIKQLETKKQQLEKVMSSPAGLAATAIRNSLQAKLVQVESQLSTLRLQENSLQAGINALKSQIGGSNTANDTDETSAETSETELIDDTEGSNIKSSDDSAQDKIDKMKAELEELEKRYAELQAKGKSVITRVGRFNVTTVQYDEETKKEMLMLSTQIQTLKSQISKAEISLLMMANGVINAQGSILNKEENDLHTYGYVG